MRFEFPAVGHVYDTNGQALVDLAREYRAITQYADIPPVVRGAILATEDKRFFTHNGVDYFSIPRVIGKVRLGAWATRLATGGRRDNQPGRAIFPQGGSTITQQLVRGVFLQHQTSQENSYQLRSPGILPRALSSLVGARNVNMVIRKREEIRLSLWIEEADASAVRVEAPREGRDARPLRKLCVHGQRPVRVCQSGAVLFRPAPLDPHRRRCRQGGAAGQHRQIAARLRADRARHGTHPPPPKPDAGADGRRTRHL